VCDAAGELPDRFHLLRLEELLLDAPAVGDVETAPEDLLRLSVVIADQHGAIQEPAMRAVGTDPAILGRHAAACLDVRDVGEHALAVLRMNALGPEVRIFDEARGGKADRVCHAFADEARPGEATLHARAVQRDRQRAHDCGLALLDLPQLAFRFELLLTDAQVLFLQHALELRLPPHLLVLEVQIDEHRDLRPQDHRVDRLEHVIDRAHRVGTRDVFVVLVDGADEDDRNVPRALATPDQLGSLVAVQAWHVRIEQDDGAFIAQQEAQRVLAGCSLDDPLLELHQHVRQCKAIVGLVVDNQDRRFGLDGAHTRPSHTRIIDTS